MPKTFKFIPHIVDWVKQLDCIYFYREKKTCYAYPYDYFPLGGRYGPTEEEIKKYCQNASREGFLSCPRLKAVEGYLKGVSKEKEDVE